MKNIIICGLIGTGKTTLSKRIAQEKGYQYVDLNSLLKNRIYNSNKELASKILFNEIKTLITPLKNCVIDCEYLILPEQYNMHNYKNNCNIVYLGFHNADINVLFNKFSADYKKKNIDFDEQKLMEQLIYFKKISDRVFDDCNKYNLKYFDISREKSEVLEEVYNYIFKVDSNV